MKPSKFKNFMLGLALFGMGLATPIGINKYINQKDANASNFLMSSNYVSSLSTSVNSLEGMVTPANQELRDFPDEINGAEKIEKYEVPGAESYLVIIKQQHYEPSEEVLKSASKLHRKKEEINKAAKSYYEEINNVQKNIYEILSSLKGSINLKKIALEGCDTNITPDDLEYNYLSRLEDIKKSGLFQEEVDKGELDKYKYIPGSDLLFGMTNNPEILSTEDLKLINKASKNKKDRSYDNSREDYAIKKIAGYNLPRCVLIYGGSHDFKDNLCEWNIKHPDKKFSLIVITPESYKEIR